MIHFAIGTRAQLFKMAPIMLECQRQKLDWRWIYTAQHKETISETLKIFGLPDPDYTVVTWQTEAKSMGKMWKWLFKMFMALPKSKKILGGYTGKKHILLTHGDTFTTWITALYAKLTRTKVMHVEAGLRSFNWREPFPEEINRLITFRLADYFACPGDWALNNLKNYKGVKINTFENTQVDTVAFGLKHADGAKFDIPSNKYVVVSLHRYENIFNKERFEHIVDELEFVAKDFLLLMVQHPTTFLQLGKLGLRQRLSANKNIHLLPRLEYLPFIKAVKNAEFVITDGGGNQEELYHMGKPTLIFRHETERKEGIGTTALISKLDHAKIAEFVANYKHYQHPPTQTKHSPTKIIIEAIKGFGVS
ncbi:UDP-N-acetylglucosamine 2-epimerase [Candidatus Berkelbacteria bacterium]|nr:UDP-N-acetylglucosamine 2-epimerase [Candidatus Berkelbacteria bacterium]